MSLSGLIRMSGLATVLAGALFVLAEPFTLFIAQNGLSEAYRNINEVALTPAFFVQAVLTFLAGVLLLGGLVGLYARQVEAAGKLGVLGFLAAFLCTALMTSDFYANALITPAVAFGDPEFLDSGFAGVLRIWFPMEFGFLTLGWVLFGIATLKAGVYPRGAALLLVIGALLAVLPLPLDNIVFDLALVWLGIALIKESNTSMGRSNI
jgi:hypothetical protein